MPDAKLQQYMTAVIGSFTVGRAEIESAFELIRKLAPVGYNVQSSQLLALRRYVKLGGARVLAQWPWTVEQQHTTYAHTIESLLQLAVQVKADFERENPGLTLGYTKARSLHRQAELWVGNDSVVLAGTAIATAAVSELTQTAYGLPPSEQNMEQFKRFLKAYQGDMDASNAAPGLSDHGQLKAVDFYVMKHGKQVAQIRRATIAVEWLHTGFAAKLKTIALANGLVGPLKKPYEPWHFGIP